MNFLKKKPCVGEVVLAVTVKLGDSPTLSIRSHARMHSFYRAARQTFGLPSRTDELSVRTKRRLDHVVLMAKLQPVTCLLIPVSQPTSEAVALAQAYLLGKCPELQGRIVDLGINYILPAKSHQEVTRYTAREKAVANWKVV